MPTALPIAEPRLSARQTARFLWLCIRVRYLHRRMERASLKVSRVGFDQAGGRLLYFAERWLACHAEAAELLQCAEPPEVVEVRKLFEHRASAGGPVPRATEQAECGAVEVRCIDQCSRNLRKNRSRMAPPEESGSPSTKRA